MKDKSLYFFHQGKKIQPNLTNLNQKSAYNAYYKPEKAYQNNPQSQKNLCINNKKTCLSQESKINQTNKEEFQKLTANNKQQLLTPQKDYSNSQTINNNTDIKPIIEERQLNFDLIKYVHLSQKSINNLLEKNLKTLYPDLPENELHQKKNEYLEVMRATKAIYAVYVDHPFYCLAIKEYYLLLGNLTHSSRPIDLKIVREIEAKNNSYFLENLHGNYQISSRLLKIVSNHRQSLTCTESQKTVILEKPRFSENFFLNKAN